MFFIEKKFINNYEWTMLAQCLASLVAINVQKSKKKFQGCHFSLGWRFMSTCLWTASASFPGLHVTVRPQHRIEIGRRATLVGAFVVCTTSVKHRRTTAGSNPRLQSRPKLLVTGYRHINSRTLAQNK